MKTILVPTDFSENAYLAAVYACSLANATKQKVQLLHVYITLYSGFGEEGNSAEQIKWAETDAVAGMQRLVEDLAKQSPHVEVVGECVNGFMIDVLTDRLKKGDVSLVVMGTKGVSNLAESVFGSTTYEVIKKSFVPVLVIPKDTSEFMLKHVGFFSDFNDAEMDALLTLRQSVRLDPKVSVLHFYKVGESEPVKALTRWQRKVHEAFPDWGLSFKALPVQHVDLNAVGQAAKSEKLDLLVFVRPHKSFFRKIFVPSLTKAVANYPIIPSLFINT